MSEELREAMLDAAMEGIQASFERDKKMGVEVAQRARMEFLLTAVAVLVHQAMRGDETAVAQAWHLIQTAAPRVARAVHEGQDFEEEDETVH